MLCRTKTQQLINTTIHKQAKTASKQAKLTALDVFFVCDFWYVLTKRNKPQQILTVFDLSFSEMREAHHERPILQN